MGRSLAIVAALLLLAGGCAGWASWRVARYDLSSLDRRMPGRTAMMRQREAEAMQAGRRLGFDERPVPYDHISPLLRRAVLVAEDDAFFSHDGLDWNEIRASARTNLSRGRIVRGGSTVTQQLAKNLFLGDARTPWRKIEEAFLAVRIERQLSKRRIFELYLNLIEWGDGIFGVEAASRRYFGVSSSDLTPRQALLLAAVIINPRRFSVLDPPPRIERRVKKIADRLHRRGVLNEIEYRDALGLPPEELPWPGASPDSGGVVPPPNAAPDSMTGAVTDSGGP